MSKIRIAIVDSGVNCEHPSFSLSKPVLITNEKIDINNLYGHGTAIYNIISKLGEQVDIVNFKLKDIEKGVSEGELFKTLKLINDKYSFDIINLSLGISICEDTEKLFQICDELVNKGTIIISAFDNTGSISYPAAFSNVIGVTSGKMCFKINDFEYVSKDVVNIGAKGGIQRLAWNNPDFVMLGGNSFACAHVTVQVAKFMLQGIKGYYNILDAFKNIAKNCYSYSSNLWEIKNNFILPFHIKRAAIFPFNKEMHSLIRFESELPFEIVGVYDSKYSANVGSTTAHIMKSDVKEMPINNISNIDWGSFDTLIVGHLDEMGGLVNVSDYKFRIIKKALKFNKNVYAFDDVKNIVESSRVYCPRVTRDDLPSYMFGKLYRISKPVIGIYGTSSRQGKFTLQLEMRKHFKKMGYKVGQLGTEPSSLLFGMDCVYPMGYNNSVYLHDYDAVRYLNNAMQRIAEKGVDIIITGSQSGVVPFDNGNLSQFSLPQIDFLLGTQPDACMLCINPFDDIDYIERTVKFIEASVDCKVIAAVVFPLDIKNDWSGIYGKKEPITTEKYEKIKKSVEQKIGVPVFLLGEEIDGLCEKVIDFFS